jgi:hypothetical protein
MNLLTQIWTPHTRGRGADAFAGKEWGTPTAIRPTRHPRRTQAKPESDQKLAFALALAGRTPFGDDARAPPLNELASLALTNEFADANLVPSYTGKGG